jgi:hypothetical protein
MPRADEVVQLKLKRKAQKKEKTNGKELEFG